MNLVKENNTEFLFTFLEDSSSKYTKIKMPARLIAFRLEAIGVNPCMSMPFCFLFLFFLFDGGGGAFFVEVIHIP